MDEACREMILSEDYRDFLIPDYRYLEEVERPRQESCIQDLGLGFRGLYINKRFVRELSIERYGYNTIPGCYGLINTDALNQSGISTVQTNPALQLSGRGVMIGIVDTGIDYLNPIFMDDTSMTRIAGIWDQTVQTGTAPEGFSYGSAYTREQIQEAVRSDTPYEIVPSRDENGHGTFLASVAAGKADTASQFQGAAPQSLLGVVKLKEAKGYLKEFYKIPQDAVCFQETDIMMGLYYLEKLAEKYGVMLVMCIALGSNFGGHDGNSMLSLMLTRYANILNRCVVIGTGNEAAKRHHFQGTLQNAGQIQEVQLRVEEGTTGFAAELWTSIPNIVTVYVTSPSGERSQTISLRQGSRYTLDFFLDGTQVDVEYRLQIDTGNSQLIFFRFTGVAPGIWTIGVQSLYLSDGEFHIWLPMEEFLEKDVFFLESNPFLTLTEPGSAQGAITVSYYNSQENSVDINSGRGYTRDSVIKPDFAVPGVAITGAGLNNTFIDRTGSSASLGLAAGGCALLMEWLDQQPAVRGVASSQVRNIIMIGTDKRSNMEYPNQEWGFGRMDLYQSLQRLREL